jgi:tetratricopeptide (TPR) repeat protein
MTEMHMIRTILLLCLLGFAGVAPSVMLGGGYSNAGAEDGDFQTALSAVAQKDWDGAIDALEKVIERRPFDDDAYTLLGYAYRKRGDYAASIGSYWDALELNPHHRGALEYLGEAYLELGERQRAMKMLDRLAAVCRQQNSPNSGDNWKQSCPEWFELESALRANDSRMRPR